MLGFFFQFDFWLKKKSKKKIFFLKFRKKKFWKKIFFWKNFEKKISREFLSIRKFRPKFYPVRKFRANFYTSENFVRNFRQQKNSSRNFVTHFLLSRRLFRHLEFLATRWRKKWAGFGSVCEDQSARITLGFWHSICKSSFQGALLLKIEART